MYVVKKINPPILCLFMYRIILCRRRRVHVRRAKRGTKTWWFDENVPPLDNHSVEYIVFTRICYHEFLWCRDVYKSEKWIARKHTCCCGRMIRTLRDVNTRTRRWHITHPQRSPWFIHGDRYGDKQYLCSSIIMRTAFSLVQYCKL